MSVTINSLFSRCINILKREMKEALMNNSCQESVYEEIFLHVEVWLLPNLIEVYSYIWRKKCIF